MNISFFTQKIRVFVAGVTSGVEAHRQRLVKVFSRAMIETVFAEETATEDDLAALIRTCNGSVHILGEDDFYNPDGGAYTSSAGVQYRVAQKITDKDFKVFLWNPDGDALDNCQYINDIRHDIVENTIYSSTLSPINFVEELRSMATQKNTVKGDVEKKDIFFIYNYLDNDTATSIAGMTEDVLSLSKLAVTMDTDTDYAEYIHKQLLGCKACVIYYDFAGDWALSFARQIWKDNGGQSGRTPIFVIGNKDHADEAAHKIFDGVLAAKICETAVIPLEIKVFFDKTTGLS